MRLFAGFAVQPFAAAILGFIVFPLIELTLPDTTGGHSTGGAASIAFGAGFAAIVVTACALPVVLWLLKRGPLKLTHVLCGGAVLGNLPLVIIMSLAILTNNVRAGTLGIGLIRSLAFGALFGVVGAALFWVISIRGTDMART